MATEQLILVDADDREVGVKEKLQTHLEGALHRAFSVFVFDANRRLLLQRRAPTKYHSGGLWSNTACGHPRPGEPTLAAAHRRLKEEMGFDCELRRAFGFVYRAELESELVEHEFDHIFIGQYEGTLAPDPSEVVDWCWVEWKELADSVRVEPHRYSSWLNALIWEHGSQLEMLIPGLEEQ